MTLVVVLLSCLHQGKEIGGKTPHFDQKMGIQTIQNALKFPVHTIVSNEGVEEDDMIERFTNLTSAKALASTLRTRSMLGRL